VVQGADWIGFFESYYLSLYESALQDPGKKPHDLLELIDDNISECSWMNSAPSEGAPSELFPILNQVFLSW